MSSLNVHPIALPGFYDDDFAVFAIDGLSGRMAGIQERIQPKFKAIGDRLAVELAPLAGNELHLHIAKHARRTVNPPQDTWLALCDNKRGYKAHPHFQLGLFDDHLFLWLAFIYELPHKSAIASAMLSNLPEVLAAVPGHYSLSLDHTKKEATPVSGMTSEDWRAALVRLRDVKKAELLIGLHLAPHDERLKDGNALLAAAVDVFERLMPLYRLACASGSASR